MGWDGVQNGELLTIAQQRNRARPYRPLPGEMQLLHRYRSSRQWRVGLATEAGRLQRAWRVVLHDPNDEAAVPDAVDGDPVLVYGVFDFQRHLKEHVVLRLSKTDGVARRFSLGEGITGGDLVVTGLRVGWDGNLYQLQGSPEVGVRVARFSLG